MFNARANPRISALGCSRWGKSWCRGISCRVPCQASHDQLVRQPQRPRRACGGAAPSPPPRVFPFPALRSRTFGGSDSGLTPLARAAPPPWMRRGIPAERCSQRETVSLEHNAIPDLHTLQTHWNKTCHTVVTPRYCHHSYYNSYCYDDNHLVAVMSTHPRAPSGHLPLVSALHHGAHRVEPRHEQAGVPPLRRSCFFSI